MLSYLISLTRVAIHETFQAERVCLNGQGDEGARELMYII